MSRFTVKGQLPGLNEYTAACRSHWGVGARMKREAQERVEWHALAAGIRPAGKPVEVRILWVEPNRRRDSDNVFFAAKFILDALVSLKVLPNDGPKWVRGISNARAVDAANPRIEVEIAEAAG